MTVEASLQVRYVPALSCFGCGPSNADGLQLKSFDAGGGLTTGESTPWPQHDNGLGYLNGGIIARFPTAISSCSGTRSAPAGLATAARSIARLCDRGLDVRYLRPAPLNRTISLGARISGASEADMKVRVWLEWKGKERSSAKAHWKRWRPR